MEKKKAVAKKRPEAPPEDAAQKEAPVAKKEGQPGWGRKRVSARTTVEHPSCRQPSARHCFTQRWTVKRCRRTWA